MDHGVHVSHSFIFKHLEALSKWLMLKKPLRYQDSAHTYIIWAIIDKPELLANGLPAASCSPKSVPWFDTNVIKAVESHGMAILPPFISNWITLPVMHEAICEVCTSLSTDRRTFCLEPSTSMKS